MLGRVVRMGGVRLIGRDQHRSADRTLEFGRRAAGRQLQYVELPHHCTRCTAHHTTDHTTTTTVPFWARARWRRSRRPGPTASRPPRCRSTPPRARSGTTRTPRRLKCDWRRFGKVVRVDCTLLDTSNIYCLVMFKKELHYPNLQAYV